MGNKQITSVLTAQTIKARQVRRANLGKKHPEIRDLISENESLRQRVEELEGELSNGRKRKS